MSKREPTPTQYLEYIAARGAAFVFGALPLPCSVALGRLIGEAFYRCDRRHRQRVIDNLDLAFRDELSAAEKQSLARAMYRHFGTMLAEFSRLGRLDKFDIDQVVDWQGHDRTLADLLAEKRGVIACSGHIGNWELGGALLHRKGLSAGAIARPLNNPLLDAYVVALRSRFGQGIWDKFGALRVVLKEIKNGRGCGMLVDQDAAKRGIFAPFFGVACSTMPTPADLALRTGAPIITCAFLRADRPLRFRFTLRGPVFPNPAADPATERLRLLTLINEHLESIIREDPAQWLWLHRRWKTRPTAAAANSSTEAN